MAGRQIDEERQRADVGAGRQGTHERRGVVLETGCEPENGREPRSWLLGENTCTKPVNGPVMNAGSASTCVPKPRTGDPNDTMKVSLSLPASVSR